MKLNELRDDVHKNAVEHGWWEEERSFGDIIALCHCELSEAMEEYRNGHKPNEVYHKAIPIFADGYIGEVEFSEIITKHKPEGIPIELADTIIRILDYCGRKKIDIEEAIRIKHEYNKTRPYKHGGKKI